MKETGKLKKWLALALTMAAVLLLCMAAAGAESTIAVGEYGQITTDNTFFRKTPNLSGDFWARLPAGWQLKVLGTTTTGTGDKAILWYKVQGGKPSAPGRTYTGYVHSGFFAAVGTVPETTPTPTPTPSNSSSASTSVSGYVRTVKSGVNIRKTPGGTVLTAKDEDKIPYNTVLAYTGNPTNDDNHVWVQVSYKGVTGYIRGDCWVFTNASGSTISDVTPSPTPAAESPYTAGALGTITLTTGGVNVRISPNKTVLGRLAKYTKLNYFGTMTVDGKLWYYVYSNDLGTYGYVLGSLARVTSGATVPPPATTPTPTPTNHSGNTSGGVTGTLKTIVDKLNIRKTPSLQGVFVEQIPKSGTSLAFTAKQVVSGVPWYRIKYKNKTGWVNGNYVKVTSSTSASTPKPTTKPSAATPIPDISKLSDVALTTTDTVFIRKDPSMSGRQLTTVSKANTKLTYNGQYSVDTTSTPGTTYTWYKVTYGHITGWMRGDFVRVLTLDEKKAYGLTGDPTTPAEASYTTLSKGSEGAAVTKLQQALYAQGYLTAADVTGTYNSTTEKAVIAFQKAKGLTQDGIAGEKTQHALYNTVPVGTYDSSTVNANLYPVEKVDWFSGDIQSIWAVTGTAVITDVYTGISFRAYRIFGGNHADAVPLTAADTKAYCQIYGTSNAQEIADRDSEMKNWRRRPLWVTVGGRTFAASMYGVPHNFPDSTVLSTNKKLANNFVGQFCVHFVNSMTHDSKTSKAHVDYDSSKNGNFGHQSAIQYAYTHSISGTK